MRDIVNSTSTSEVKKVWMRGAILIRDDAKRRAPILQSDKHGLKWWQRPGALKNAIFAAYGKEDAPNVLVGVNYRLAPQAHWIEFGTAFRDTRKGAARGSSPPHPYMRPALAAQQNNAMDAMAQGYRELIEKAATK